MKAMLPRLRERSVRLLALLALVAGLLAPAVPGHAMPAQPAAMPQAMHAATDCSGKHNPAPAKHAGSGVDCCIASVCAMNLTLPHPPSAVAPSFPQEASAYDLSALLQPSGIEPVPIPHPPKTTA